MARIRSVKPGLRTSRVVARWPFEIRYFWVLLWGYLDDKGRGLDIPKAIAGDCFPLDDRITAVVINRWLAIMAGTKIEATRDSPVCRYEVAGTRYLHCVYWEEHQRPNRPSPSRHPPCPVHESLTESLTESDSELPPVDNSSHLPVDNSADPVDNSSHLSPRRAQKRSRNGHDHEKAGHEKVTERDMSRLIDETRSNSGRRSRASPQVTVLPLSEPLSESPHAGIRNLTEGELEGVLREPLSEPPPTPPPQEPPSKCDKHLTTPNPPDCGACGNARRAHSRWEAERNRRIAAAPKCRVHRGQLADNCALCRAEELSPP